MSQGLGSSLSTSQRTPPAGPPFVLSSADNGLSVDPISGKIVLGQDVGALGDPAQLLSNRDIPMNGNFFRMTDLGNQLFLIDPLNANAFLVGTDSVSSAGVNVSAVTGLGTFVELSTADGGSGAGGDLRIDGLTGSFNLLASTSAGAHNAIISGNGSLTPSIQAFLDNHEYFNLDLGADVYQLGDLQGVNNSIALDIHNGNVLGPGFFLGNITGAANTSPMIQGLNLALLLASSNTVVPTYMGLIATESGGLRQSGMGDVGVTGAGNTAVVDDLTGKFLLDNTAHTTLVNINGVDGFSGTVTPVTSITVNGGIVTNVT